MPCDSPDWPLPFELPLLLWLPLLPGELLEPELELLDLLGPPFPPPFPPALLLPPPFPPALL